MQKKSLIHISLPGCCIVLLVVTPPFIEYDLPLYVSGYMEHLHKPDHYVILLHVPERHAFIVGRK